MAKRTLTIYHYDEDQELIGKSTREIDVTVEKLMDEQGRVRIIREIVRECSTEIDNDEQ